MGRIEKLIYQSAAEWSIPPKVAEFAFWAPWVSSAVLIMLRLHKDIYRFLLFEDGPVEWAQFMCFAVASVGGALVARALFRRGLRPHGLLFAVYAAAMVFMAGEEISWGQRVFEIETPDELRAVNRQGEITIHNIGSVKEYFNFAMMVGGGLGGTFYAVNRRVKLQRYIARADCLFVPPFFLSSAFLVTSLYELVRFTIWHESGFTITKYAEWSEFCFALGLAGFTLLILRRLNAEQRHPAAAYARTRASDDSHASRII